MATAQVVTTTEVTIGRIHTIFWEWLCTDLGVVSSETTKVFNGEILAIVTDPDTNAPSDNYDITIVDGDGQDVLFGQGANRDTANTEFKLSTDSTPMGAVGNSKLTLTIAAAGDANEGTVKLWIRS